MITVKEVVGYKLIEREIPFRVLKDAKCYCEICKSPIEIHSKIKFGIFNYPKDYIHDKFYELMYISKYGSFNQKISTYENRADIQKYPDIYLNFTFTTFDAVPLLNNNAACVMYLNHEDQAIRFFSNFLITFEIDEIKYI